MGVYTRFKKDPSGLRKLVELLESTPMSRRQKMIDVGMQEDPDYTQKALAMMMTWDDVMKLPDMELAEVIGKSPSARTVAYAIKPYPADITDRWLKNSRPQTAAEIKDTLTQEIQPRDTGAAQLKLVSIARALEKAGLVKAKRIP